VARRAAGYRAGSPADVDQRVGSRIVTSSSALVG
jgi:hypothetical protein